METDILHARSEGHFTYFNKLFRKKSRRGANHMAEGHPRGFYEPTHAHKHTHANANSTQYTRRFLFILFYTRSPRVHGYCLRVTGVARVA